MLNVHVLDGIHAHRSNVAHGVEVPAADAAGNRAPFVIEREGPAPE